jgi:signal transduction histidine kinase
MGKIDGDVSASARDGGPGGAGGAAERRFPAGDDYPVRPAAPAERRYAAPDASFLAEASRLLADSLDYETTLATVAMLALPHLGAWCIVDVVEEDGDIRRVGVIHPDPEMQAMARELRDGWPPGRDDPLGVPVVARTRRSELVPTVDAELIERAARSERNLWLLEQLGIGSLMIVPLLARGDVLGAITFVAPQTEHRYGPRDMALAEDLAARAAIAIDNARLYRMAERAREAAERASQAKSQFLGVMSHELRTPINVIMGYVQLMEMGVRGSLTDGQRELLQRVGASSRHLLELVTRVLDVSKAETGELVVQSQLQLVDDVVSDALNEVRGSADGRQITTRSSQERLRFLGDGIRARQILVNLLSNAIRFTDDDGRIAIVCEQVKGPVGPELLKDAGPWVRICVEDNGSGIPQNRIEAVFEPFVQGDASPLIRENDGSGLGLAISRYLARLMGGELTVTSVPGEGSRFSLWLPAPRVLTDARRDRRLFPRETEGLRALSDHLLQRLKPIMDRYVERLRQDGAVPRAREASDVALRDHVPHFLTGVASLLSHADSAGEEASAVLQSGQSIQRLILELHGAQRHSLGWGQEAVRRDLALLREVIEKDLRAEAQHDADVSELTAILASLFEQADRISLQGWHYARSDSPQEPAETRESLEPEPEP